MLKKIDPLVKNGSIFLLTLYQKILSPDHSVWAKLIYPYGYCRYYPTCSEYAKETLTIYAFPTALKLILKRVLRCNPWARGGFDYTPQPPKD